MEILGDGTKTPLDYELMGHKIATKMDHLYGHSAHVKQYLETRPPSPLRYSLTLYGGAINTELPLLIDVHPNPNDRRVP